MDFNLHHIFLVDQIIKNELGGSCSTYGKQDSCMYSFGLYNLFKGVTCNFKRRWENIIKMYLQDVECGGMDWIERSFGFYNRRIDLRLSEDLLHVLEGFCSVGFDRCTVKYKHLLKTVLRRLEVVQITAEEDKKMCSSL